MEKLYLVKHSRLSIVYKSPKDDIGKNIDNIRVFKKREKAVKFIDEQYNSWADVGTNDNGIEIYKKERLADSFATVSYYAHGVYESIDVVEHYILEEVDYDE